MFLSPFSLGFFFGTQTSPFAVKQLNVVNVDVQLARSAHSTLFVGLCDGCHGNCASLNHERSIHAHVLNNREVDLVSFLSIFRRKRSVQTKLYRLYQREVESVQMSSGLTLRNYPAPDHLVWVLLPAPVGLVRVLLPAPADWVWVFV